MMAMAPYRASVNMKITGTQVLEQGKNHLMKFDSINN